MREVRVVGAGFSGLTLAYYLKKADPEIKVTIVDRRGDVGGLLQSEVTTHGVVEKAANALLDTEALRALADDIGLELLEAAPGIKRGYILRKGRLKGWPLGFFETLGFLRRIIPALFCKNFFVPRAQTSVEKWAVRNLGGPAAQYLIDPVLAGIYAAPIEELSAKTIFGRFFVAPSSNKYKPHPKRKKLRSVAPRLGMNEFAQKLKKFLLDQGVEIVLGQNEVFNEAGSTVTVLCTSLGDAQRFLQPITHADRRFKEFFALRMIPISTTTQFYDRPLPYRAFGNLYPRSEQRAFLGTLFNAQIFPSRYTKASETWIRSQIKDERTTLKEIAEERRDIFRQTDAPLRSYVTEWPEGLPFYNLQLEEFLGEPWAFMREELKAYRIYLHGNYLGKLGLSQLLLASKEVAQEVAR